MKSMYNQRVPSAENVRTSPIPHLNWKFTEKAPVCVSIAREISQKQFEIVKILKCFLNEPYKGGQDKKKKKYFSLWIKMSWNSFNW